VSIIGFSVLAGLIVGGICDISEGIQAEAIKREQDLAGVWIDLSKTLDKINHEARWGTLEVFVSGLDPADHPLSWDGYVRLIKQFDRYDVAAQSSISKMLGPFVKSGMSE
jgi:hypothetical protein